jgi:methylthioribose-1-phosphate isomerase
MKATLKHKIDELRAQAPKITSELKRTRTTTDNLSKAIRNNQDAETFFEELNVIRTMKRK